MKKLLTTMVFILFVTTAFAQSQASTQAVQESTIELTVSELSDFDVASILKEKIKGFKMKTQGQPSWSNKGGKLRPTSIERIKPSSKGATFLIFNIKTSDDPILTEQLLLRIVTKKK